ncbi:MAG TPA: riboflavin synthase [Verrucomicrobiales bacterium]|nr:riboflavin synthase [Verrucomicrobiales bacterium]
MFTGIVEETGKVLSIIKNEDSIRLKFSVKNCGKKLKKGDSIAVNGCCLTAVNIKKSGASLSVRVDLLHETWIRTNLQYLETGDSVNLERAVKASDRMGGHFVTGHVDGIGKILQIRNKGSDIYLSVTVPKSLIKYILLKGSICIDGISLTVAEVRKQSIAIWIIPHTIKVTNLKNRKVGDNLNLETDLLGKYVYRILQETQK